MQRHFVTLAVHVPSTEVTTSIYGTLLGAHLEGGAPFSAEITGLGPRLVEAMIDLHRQASGACTF